MREGFGSLEKRKLIFEAVTEEMVAGGDAVFPTDFLAFRVGTSVVDDGDFVHSRPDFGHLDGEFRLQAEAVAPDADAVEDVAGKDLVTGGDIVQREVGEHVAHDGKEAIEDVAVVAGDPVRTPMESIAKYGICMAFEYGAEEFGVILGVVFQVGVLNQNQFP